MGRKNKKTPNQRISSIADRKQFEAIKTNIEPKLFAVFTHENAEMLIQLVRKISAEEIGYFLNLPKEIPICKKSFAKTVLDILSEYFNYAAGGRDLEILYDSEIQHKQLKKAKSNISHIISQFKPAQTRFSDALAISKDKASPNHHLLDYSALISEGDLLEFNRLCNKAISLFQLDTLTKIFPDIDKTSLPNKVGGVIDNSIKVWEPTFMELLEVCGLPTIMAADFTRHILIALGYANIPPKTSIYQRALERKI